MEELTESRKGVSLYCLKQVQPTYPFLTLKTVIFCTSLCDTLYIKSEAQRLGEQLCVLMMVLPWKKAPLWCNLGNKILKISPTHCFYPRSILTSAACDCLHRGGAGSERGVSLLFLTCILTGHLTRSTGRKEKLWTGAREPEEDGPTFPSS